MLSDGKVLAAGGYSFASGYLASAELFDPVSGIWSSTGSPADARYSHSATLLPNGKVLVAGGFANNLPLATAELYDPASGTWAATGNLITTRDNHTATLLFDGKVLVAGGYGLPGGVLESAELYDPASGIWSATTSLADARVLETATLLPNGNVLTAGGDDDDEMALGSAELYDVGLAFESAWQPQIRDLKLTRGRRLLLTGRQFQGISQASFGSTQDSSTNYPVVQLRAIGNEQVSFLFPEEWSVTTFKSGPLLGLVGPALATIFTNGIPSDATYLVMPPQQ